jgi:hypothetical protein
LDEHMDLLRALEMSRLQYLRDAGLLHEPDPDKLVVLSLSLFVVFFLNFTWVVALSWNKYMITNDCVNIPRMFTHKHAHCTQDIHPKI